ncbi:uncharacterized protein [Panulirus ornatus]|uniref:uncharacterized protein n=1 Tax=Panulirus ornatus TaxID=150431 RepID=UPI003A8638AD
MTWVVNLSQLQGYCCLWWRDSSFVYLMWPSVRRDSPRLCHMITKGATALMFSRLEHRGTASPERSKSFSWNDGDEEEAESEDRLMLKPTHSKASSDGDLLGQRCSQSHLIRCPSCVCVCVWERQVLCGGGGRCGASISLPPR